MINVGVIIKHPYRDYDWRIDIYEVEEETTDEEITEHVNSKMLGPFEVVGISRNISYKTNYVNRNLLEYDMKAKKGDRVLSNHIDPSISWVIHSVTSTSIVVKDKNNPRDKQTLKHGMYTVAIN